MKYTIYVVLLTALATMSGCKKFLSATPDKSLTVPTTLSDLQALQENNSLFFASPSGTELGSDDYYLDYTTWQSWNLVFRNSYVWAPDVYEGAASATLDWGRLYNVIYTCNIVLDGLKGIKVTSDNEVKYHFIEGMALFYRSFSFFNLAQEYAKPYRTASASTDLGIPLRLNDDLNAKTFRATVQATYDQIIKDLQQAVLLVPSNIQTNHLNYPSKPVVYALLARTYLSMGNYHNAGLYADSSLQLYNKLMDYNTIDLAARFPFARNNPETMLQCYINTTVNVVNTFASTTLVDTTLYNSYTSNDLRKAIFFKPNSAGERYYHASYTGLVFLFNGFATDEMYLTRAEAYARDGNTNAAMDDLNTLLQTRWKTGTFVPYTATTAEDALNLILQERRKELLYRGLRWTDLRRLNQEPQFAITLTRVLNGQIYTLQPNDPRYVYPIPDDEIKLTGIQQNER